MRISGGIQSCKTLSVRGVLKNPHKKQQYKGKDVSFYKIREIQWKIKKVSTTISM